MPNPLQTGQGGPPDAPQGGQPQVMQQGPPQQIAPPQAPQGPPQAPQAPAPTHAQTVAALRHFHAIGAELQGLLRDPDIGKVDMKGKIIDGATKLVAQKIFSPAQAVASLGDVPDKPFDQKQWVLSNFEQIKQAADAVLDHHRMAFAGQPDDLEQPGASPDDHMKTMDALHGHYQGLSRG